MSLFNKVSSGCAVCAALMISGCGGGGSAPPSAASQIPVTGTAVEKQNAAQKEVNKSMEVMKQTMEASGGTAPPGGSMPGFQLPPPPGGAATGGTPPKGTAPTGSAPAPSSSKGEQKPNP